VRLPGSKSISNRVLLLAGLAQGTTAVHDLLDSDDTRVMLDALAALGCGLRRDGGVLHVTGLGGRLAVHEAKLFLGNAGTAMRPLAAALAVLAATQADASNSTAWHACTSGRSATSSTRYGHSAARSKTWAHPAIRRCASAARPAAGATTLPIRVRGDVSSSSSPPCCWHCRWWRIGTPS